jgi:nucleotide-binding universal stress UspA family protein
MTAGPLGSEMFIAESPAVYEARLDEAKAHLTHRTGSARLLGIDVKTDVVNGSTAKAIVEYAISHGCSLIVMGTHGRTGISHLLMGSVAERVVREAPCPVLTVRQAPAEADLPVGVREATA